MTQKLTKNRGFKNEEASPIEEASFVVITCGEETSSLRRLNVTMNYFFLVSFSTLTTSRP
jgi:hypothetical protein